MIGGNAEEYPVAKEVVPNVNEKMTTVNTNTNHIPRSYTVNPNSSLNVVEQVRVKKRHHILVVPSPSLQMKNVETCSSTKIALPKGWKKQLILQEDDGVDDDNEDKGGKDLDKESTAQNFKNAARQGDISSRQREKGKSVGKGRKKQ